MIENVAIADDHSLILDGFEKILQRDRPDLKIFKVKNKPGLMKVLAENRVDVLFQDVKFGAFDARDFIEEIRRHYPKLKILIISTFNDQTTVKALFKQGVDGYISKADDSKELLAALESMERGETFFSPEVKRTNTTTIGLSLTSGERKVLLLIMEGFTTRQIAGKVHLSEKTIEIYRSNLLVKFDVRNVAALVKRAIYEGFI